MGVKKWGYIGTIGGNIRLYGGLYRGKIGNKPLTLNPKPCTINHKPCNIGNEPQTLYRKPRSSRGNEGICCMQSQGAKGSNA